MGRLLLCIGLFFLLHLNVLQIKPINILAVLRRNVSGICGAHLRVIVPGQHSFFQGNVAAVANRWQPCVPASEKNSLPLDQHRPILTNKMKTICLFLLILPFFYQQNHFDLILIFFVKISNFDHG